VSRVDTLRITGLKVEALIGVHEWERRLPRPVIVDLAIAADAAAAAASDRIGAALDYSAVAQAVGRFVGDSRLALIETLAEQLAARLMADFRISWLTLTLHKPGAVPGAQDVSITIERGARK
jgi:7,8-dihydroneopterin aldolase/epimerase/oxygenase